MCSYWGRGGKILVAIVIDEIHTMPVSCILIGIYVREVMVVCVRKEFHLNNRPSVYVGFMVAGVALL